jgi:predicted dehydrogenase
MVGHLLEYHPVVERLRQMIDRDELGRVLYLYSQRLNLGTVREDENALWNFAPHDISVMLYLTGQEPVSVSANGQAYLRPGVEDIAFLTMRFADDTLAHVHVSWLDPHKTRRLTVVGDKMMAVFDDLEPSEKLRIFDKGADRNLDYDTFAEYISLRTGDIRIPHIKMGEPLRIECQHFVDCVQQRRQPKSDGHDGLRVVTVLEAAERSLRSGGVAVDLGGRSRAEP